ncbi:MAG: dihydropteroate synthase [Lactobacillales bacterium]|nr:dihydropteroate synthase [Lactobacillales bacterium]
MGILNVTPDSFSDGGEFTSFQSAVLHAQKMIQDGVDIIDVGGQSTRPGYIELPASAEKLRVVPVVEAIRRMSDIPISVDTYFPEVADAALEAGANIINDVRGLDTPGMAEVIAKHKAKVIIMHSRPRDCSKSLEAELQQFYKEKVVECERLGIGSEDICFDPGVGWKGVEEDLQIIHDPNRYRLEGFPMMVGISRKRVMGYLLDEPDPKLRDLGSIAASTILLRHGVDIVRVHNTKGMVDALNMIKVFDDYKPLSGKWETLKDKLHK